MKKFLNLGTMMQAKKKTSDPDEPKKFYLKLEQQKKKDGTLIGEQLFPITLANGVKLNDGDIISLQSKREKLQKMVDDDRMTQEKADQLASFLIFDMVAVVDESEEKKKDGDNIDF